MSNDQHQLETDTSSRERTEVRTDDGLVELLAVLQQLLHGILHDRKLPLVVIKLRVCGLCSLFQTGALYRNGRGSLFDMPTLEVTMCGVLRAQSN